MTNFHTANIRDDDWKALEALRKKWGERSIAATIGRMVKEAKPQ